MLIKRMLFVPLGVDSTPIGLRKCVDPVTAVTAGYNLATGLGNFISQGEGNSMNYQLQLDTNRLNKQMADEANQMSQAQFDKNMEWLREQYYDTDQYVRLREAAQKGGFNPALAMGEVKPVGSVGQSSPTAFHAAQFEAPHLDSLSLDPLASSVGQAVNAYFSNKLVSSQSENVDADTQTKRINNMTQFAKNLAELHNLWEDVESKRSQRGLSDSQKKYYEDMSEEIRGKIRLFMDTYNDLKVRERKTNDVLDAQKDDLLSGAALKRAQASYQNVLTAWYPDIAQSEIAVASAQFNDLVRSAELKVKEGELTDANKVSQYIKNGIDSLEFIKEHKRYKTHNSNKATRVFYGTLDEIGHTLFSNIRLLGK